MNSEKSAKKCVNIFRSILLSAGLISKEETLLTHPCGVHTVQMWQVPIAFSEKML